VWAETASHRVRNHRFSATALAVRRRGADEGTIGSHARDRVSNLFSRRHRRHLDRVTREREGDTLWSPAREFHRRAKCVQERVATFPSDASTWLTVEASACWSGAATSGVKRRATRAH
jgi:hypothetical protein